MSEQTMLTYVYANISLVYFLNSIDNYNLLRSLIRNRIVGKDYKNKSYYLTELGKCRLDDLKTILK